MEWLRKQIEDKIKIYEKDNKYKGNDLIIIELDEISSLIDQMNCETCINEKTCSQSVDINCGSYSILNCSNFEPKDNCK